MQLRDVYAKHHTAIGQLEDRIFHFLDAELCTRRTPFEARTYQKLINALIKTRLVDTFYTD